MSEWDVASHQPIAPPVDPATFTSAAIAAAHIAKQGADQTEAMLNEGRQQMSSMMLQIQAIKEHIEQVSAATMQTAEQVAGLAVHISNDRAVAQSAMETVQRANQELQGLLAAAVDALKTPRRIEVVRDNMGRVSGGVVQNGEAV